MSRQLDSTGLKRLHRTWRRQSTARVALLLDRLQGPFNVGSILRTAAAYSVDRLWLVEGTVAPDDAKVAKTALGSGRFVDWAWCATVEQAAAAARAEGYRVVGLELADDAVPLPELAVGPATCLVIGHEDRGLSPPALAAVRRPGLHPPARADRLAQRGHGHRHRPLRGAPPGVGGGACRRVRGAVEIPGCRGGGRAYREPSWRHRRSDPSATTRSREFLGVQRTAMLYPPPTDRDLELREAPHTPSSAASLSVLDEGASSARPGASPPT